MNNVTVIIDIAKINIKYMDLIIMGAIFKTYR